MRKILVGLYVAMRHYVAVPRDFLYCTFSGVRYSFEWQFIGLPLFQRRKGSTITIGRRLRACSKARWNSIGVFQRVMLKTVRPAARIEIGDDVGMSGCVISASSSIRIGNYVLIGSGALITDSDAHALDWRERRCGKRGNSEPIIIEDDVFIGARAIVLKGVRIGRGAVVGAGAVVSKDVPSNCVVVGNPARIVKELCK